MTHLKEHEAGTQNGGAEKTSPWESKDSSLVTSHSFLNTFRILQPAKEILTTVVNNPWASFKMKTLAPIPSQMKMHWPGTTSYQLRAN